MDIANLINNQSKLNSMTLRELRNIVERFPFYHAARLLYVMNIYQLHEPNLSEELVKASVLLPDRTKLFEMIEGKNYQLENGNANAIDIESDDNRTMTLIDKFLSTLPENNEHDNNTAPHAIPTIAELTNDYASFLQMSNDSISDFENVNQFDNQNTIIDSFIQENKGKQRYELNDNINEPEGPGESQYDKLDDVYNENIVNIYIKQGRYQQALEILKTICLNNPEKNTIFASQMRLLETIVNNNKTK